MSATDIDDEVAGLDLRPLARLHQPSLEILEPLRRREPGAVVAARALLDQEDAALWSARAALIALGIHGLRVHDALGLLLGEIGTGDIGYELDVAEGRCEADQ